MQLEFTIKEPKKVKVEVEFPICGKKYDSHEHGEFEYFWKATDPDTLLHIRRSRSWNDEIWTSYEIDLDYTPSYEMLTFKDHSRCSMSEFEEVRAELLKAIQNE